jgi:hypothetical protein
VPRRMSRVPRIPTEEAPRRRYNILCEQANRKEPGLLINQSGLRSPAIVGKTPQAAPPARAAGLAPHASLRAKPTHITAPAVVAKGARPFSDEAVMAEGVEGRHGLLAH